MIMFQYMSLILYHNEGQKQEAQDDYKRMEQSQRIKLITEIAPAATFYPAEEWVLFLIILFFWLAFHLL